MLTGARSACLGQRRVCRYRELHRANLALWKFMAFAIISCPISRLLFLRYEYPEISGPELNTFQVLCQDSTADPHRERILIRRTGTLCL